VTKHGVDDGHGPGVGQGWQEGRAAHAVLNVKGDDLIVASANVGARQSPPCLGIDLGIGKDDPQPSYATPGYVPQTSWFSATARAMVVEVDRPHHYGKHAKPTPPTVTGIGIAATSRRRKSPTWPTGHARRVPIDSSRTATSPPLR